jgi:hypothetical protein
MIIKATEQQENKMVKNNRQMWTAMTEHVFDFDCGFQLTCPMSKAEGTGKQKIPERAKVRMRLHAETCGCNAHDVYLMKDAREGVKWIGMSRMRKQEQERDDISIIYKNGRKGDDGVLTPRKKKEYQSPNPISITFQKDGKEIRAYDYYPEPKDNNPEGRERITNEFGVLSRLKDSVLKIAMIGVKAKQRRMIEERVATARFLADRRERLRNRDYIEETGETIVFKGFDNM